MTAAPTRKAPAPLIRYRAAGLSVALAILTGTFAQHAAAAVVRFTFEQLARRSALVVAGEVIELRSYRAPLQDVGEVIFTDVRLRVTRVLQGEPESDEITIQVLGGEIGTKFQTCPDSPRYEIGEKVLVFLRRWNGHLFNTGWLQGKYRLSEDDRGATVVRGRRGLPVFVDLPLDDVEARLKAIRPSPSGAAPETGPVAPAPVGASEDAAPAVHPAGEESALSAPDRSGGGTP